MLTRTLTLATVLALAGCLGAEPPAEEPVAPAAAVDEPENAVVEAEMETMLVPEPILTPVSYAGRTPAGVCQFIAGQCEWTQPGTEDFHLLDAPGVPQWLSITIAYGEQSPTMEFWAGVCPEGQDGSETCSEYVTGPSPLAVEVDLAQFEEGPLGISVGSISSVGPQTGTLVFGAADFEVTGTITSFPDTPDTVAMPAP